MPEIDIRIVKQEDLSVMIELDHSYKTNHILRMEVNEEGNQINTSFHQVRLPRTTTIQYPRDEDNLIHSWQLCTSIYVGTIRGEIVSYIGLEEISPSSVVRIRDIVVSPSYRRMGIASGLIFSAEKWAASRKYSLMILEMQPKNDPAIHLARKLGYSFSGFQNRFYPNQEMAVFFEKYIS